MSSFTYKDLHVEVIYNKKLKHSYIKVIKEFQVIIKTPVKSRSFLDELLASKYNWIKKQSEILKNRPRDQKISLEDSKKIAMDGVKTVGDFMTDLYAKQKDNAAKSQEKWEKVVKKIKEQLDAVAKDRNANVHIKLKDVQHAENIINKLTADETKHIKIITTTVEKKQTGGAVGLKAAGGAFVRRSGALGGYGGGDKIRALLEAGEYVVRKEAVAHFGLDFFNRLNAMRLVLPDIKAKMGGLISKFSFPEIPVPGFSLGGQVSSPAETLVVRFQAGDIEAPVKITDPDSRIAMKKLAQEMAKMRLIHAR
jgi:hypothetical protein